ncbi:MAG: hypothetical protein KTR14_07635, partial [Vampirovibrio sp.]|nr:hypothetical protein [Vampirovibrio sp.]
TVVGFDENFNYDRVMNKADGFIGKLTHLITPNEDTALFFQKRFKTIPVKALGHPTLETYMQKIGNTNRMDIQRRLNLDVTKPTVLYVGGLGNGYGKAYEAFCKAVASMKNANILFLPHPKTNGEIEKRILLEHPEHQIQTLDPNIGIETALAVSDIVAFHDSTMSVQALFAGKQVLHIGNPIAQTETSKFEPAVARNLAKRYKSVVDIRQGLMAAIDHYKKQSAAVHQIRTNNLNKLLGIPTNSTERITDYLLSLVKAPKTEAL